MLPLQALLSHAELCQSKPADPEQVDARTTPRRPRYGNLTVYPVVHRTVAVDPLIEEEPTLAASLSNISRHGVGLISVEPLPAGTQFEVRWAMDGGVQLMRFLVVHSRPTLDGMYRTGARLLAGELPEEPAPMPLPETTSAQPMVLVSIPTPSAVVQTQAPATPQCSPEPTMQEPEIAGTIGLDSETAPESRPAPGILRIEPSPLPIAVAPHTLPPGTFQASVASGFEKVERLDGVTTCGWERQVELRRVGDRLWIYIHSPGKKNGWGLFVDPDAFEAALGRIQDAATCPFLPSLAA